MWRRKTIFNCFADKSHLIHWQMAIKRESEKEKMSWQTAYKAMVKNEQNMKPAQT